VQLPKKSWCFGPGLYGAPAFIMPLLLAALYLAILPQRGLRFAPVLCRYNRRTSSGEEKKGWGFAGRLQSFLVASSDPNARCSGTVAAHTDGRGCGADLAGGPGPIGVRLSGTPALYNTCALGHVVLHPPPMGNVAFALRPLRVARGRRWCDHECPRWGVHTTDELLYFLVLGAPASLIGSELLQGHL
jgi:hypothetical protein